MRVHLDDEADAPAMLRALARTLRARVRACNIYNPNVGERERQQFRTSLGDRRVTVGNSDSKIIVECKGLDTLATFAVNDIDRVCLFDEPLGSVAGLTCPVFVHTGKHARAAAWLQADENVALVAALDLQPGESLQVYGNAVVLIGRPERASRDTLSMLGELVDRLASGPRAGGVDPASFSPEGLPPDLRALEDLVRRYGVDDDAEREQVLADATAEEREQLLACVTPLLGRIHEFLDSFGDLPLSDQAMRIGRLAEAVDELRNGGT